MRARASFSPVYGPADFDIEATAAAPIVATPAAPFTGRPAIVADANMLQSGTDAPIYGTCWTAKRRVISRPPMGIGQTVFSVSDPTKASVAGASVNYVADGEFDLIGTVGGQSKTYPLTNSHTQAAATVETTAFDSWATGSLAKHCRDSLRAFMTGHTPPGCLTHFTCIDNDTGEYQHNAASWLYALRQPLTCMSPWNSRLKNQGGGTLVTRKHAITCNHTPSPSYQAGDLFHFIAADNSIITATVAEGGYQQIGSTDIGLLTFTADVAESISIADILPDDYADYLPTLNTGTAAYRYLECLRTNQSKQITIAMLSGVSGAGEWSIVESTVADEATFIDAVETGDSGSPRFLIVNGGLVLLFAVHSFPDVGPSPVVNRAAIEAVTGEGYALSQIDLSSFENYGA